MAAATAQGHVTDAFHFSFRHIFYTFSFIGLMLMLVQGVIVRRVAGRVAVNVSGASQFTEGNFAGVGLSIEKKLTEWAAFNGDVRATIVLDPE